MILKRVTRKSLLCSHCRFQNPGTICLLSCVGDKGVKLELSDRQKQLSYAMLTGLWLAIAVNCIVPFNPAWLANLLYWSGIIMGLTHLAEVAFFVPKMTDQTNKFFSCLMVFLFGIVYAGSRISDPSLTQAD